MKMNVFLDFIHACCEFRDVMERIFSHYLFDELFFLYSQPLWIIHDVGKDVYINMYASYTPLRFQKKVLWRRISPPSWTHTRREYCARGFGIIGRLRERYFEGKLFRKVHMHAKEEKLNWDCDMSDSYSHSSVFRNLTSPCIQPAKELSSFCMLKSLCWFTHIHMKNMNIKNSESKEELLLSGFLMKNFIKFEKCEENIRSVWLRICFNLNVVIDAVLSHVEIMWKTEINLREMKRINECWFEWDDDDEMRIKLSFSQFFPTSLLNAVSRSRDCFTLLWLMKEKNSRERRCVL